MSRFSSNPPSKASGVHKEAASGAGRSRAGSRQQQKEATRQRILDAAISSFARLGYDGTNFREITVLSGAERPLILYHYQSKELLWKQAVEEIELRFNKAFDARYQPETEPELNRMAKRKGDSGDREKVRYAMHCFVGTLCAVPEYSQILLREGSSHGPRMQWLARHFVPRQVLQLELDDPSIVERIQKTVLRDILASALLAFVALGPLMEASLAGVTKQKTAGVHPLSEARKAELVEYMLKLVFD